MRTLFIILLFLVTKFSAQNLVVNPSFENYSSCPCGTGLISSAVGWNDRSLNSSDYYNTCCSLPNMQVPNVFGGWQYPKTGNGYGGIASWLPTFLSGGFNQRDYLKGTLNQALDSGKKYGVSFYYNTANKSKYGHNGLQMFIANNFVQYNTVQIIQETPQIFKTDCANILDTVNWYEVKGIYSALGGEDYFIIGNFLQENQLCIDSMITNSINGTYHYIDDVSIYELPTMKAGNDTIVCSNTPFSLGLNLPSGGGYTYQWFTSTNPNLGTSQIISVNPTVTTKYYVSVSDTNNISCVKNLLDSVVVTVVDCGSIGLNEHATKHFSILSPNPSYGKTVFKYSIQESSYGLIEIYSMDGKLQYSKILMGGSNMTELDLSSLSNGVYFYKLNSDNVLIETNKLILNK